MTEAIRSEAFKKEIGKTYHNNFTNTVNTMNKISDKKSFRAEETSG